MAELTRVEGFIYQQGSMDYPSNYSPDDKFGFDSEHGKPVFNYSVNDVERAFKKCRTLTRTSYYHSGTNKTNVLLAENSNGALDNENINDNFWIQAFRVIEFLYENQATAANPSSDPDKFNSEGDRLLSSDSNPDGSSNKFYVPIYIPKSLRWLKHVNPNRLDWAEFEIKYSSRYITIHLNFYADTFVERSENRSYAVYRYEDISDPVDSEISPEEFNSQIVTKLFGILKEGKYKIFKEYNVDKRLSDSEIVKEQFFVFSSLADEKSLDENTMKIEIVKYLETKYDDDVYLRYTYPTLFAENRIDIIPLYDNTIERIGSGESELIHPLSISKLSETLVKNNLSINPGNNSRPVEIFHVGPGAGWTPGVGFELEFPLLAVERDYQQTAIILPISKRFPNYKPIYGENEKGEAAEFHFILITILRHLLKPQQNILSEEFKRSYNVLVIYNEEGNRVDISFSFAGEIWNVQGPYMASKMDIDVYVKKPSKK